MDWRRSSADSIEAEGYRITRSHVTRLLHAPTPIFHCYAPGGAFLGTVGQDAEAARELCETHHATREARPC